MFLLFCGDVCKDLVQFVTVSDFSIAVVIVVSLSVLLTLVTILMTCLCCYAASGDEESNDGLLLEQYSEKSLTSVPSASSIR